MFSCFSPLANVSASLIGNPTQHHGSTDQLVARDVLQYYGITAEVLHFGKDCENGPTCHDSRKSNMLQRKVDSLFPAGEHAKDA